MGAKNSNGIVIDKASIVDLILFCQARAPQLQALSEDMRDHIRVLRDQEELMVGNRADTYKSCLGDIQTVAGSLAAFAREIQKAANDQYTHLQANVDSAARDSKAQTAADRVKRLKRNSKLRGQ